MKGQIDKPGWQVQCGTPDCDSEASGKYAHLSEASLYHDLKWEYMPHLGWVCPKCRALLRKQRKATEQAP